MRAIDLTAIPRLIVVLFRSGLLSFRPTDLPAILQAWWRCRAGFAFLAEVAAIRWGARVALRDEDGPLTFAELQKESTSLALRLAREVGLGAGAQVGLIARNHRGFVRGLLACTRLGADVLALNPDLPPGVLKTISARQKIEGFLCEPELAGRLGHLEIPHWPWLGREVTLWDEDLPPVARAGELIVLTSGTSGISKGVRRRPELRHLLPLMAGLLDNLRLELHRPAVPAIPLHHGYGLATLAVGLAMGSPLELARRYEIAPLMQRLAPEEEPFLISVPTLLKRWLAAPQAVRGPRPAAVITGSAPLDPELCRELLEKLGPVLFNLYGSSEAGLISLALPQTLALAPGSVGRPLPGNTVRLVDAQDKELPPGDIGRILAKGPFVLPSRADGWRDTGDLGRWDPDQNLFVCGRADSMIVSGGENVYPHEVEAVLLSHPEVSDAVVWAVPDEQFGQRLAAAVAPHPDAYLEAESLVAWLKQQLERHKMPRSLHLLPEIPRSSLGKVDRVALEGLLGSST